MRRFQIAVVAVLTLLSGCSSATTTSQQNVMPDGSKMSDQEMAAMTSVQPSCRTQTNTTMPDMPGMPTNASAANTTCSGPQPDTSAMTVRTLPPTTVPKGGHSHGPGQVMFPTVGGDAHGATDSIGGYSLVFAEEVIPQGLQTVHFTILKDGVPVTAFMKMHGAVLHLMAIDATADHYIHMHPTLGQNGVWQADLNFEGVAPWRVITDTMVADGQLVLGTTFGVGEHHIGGDAQRLSSDSSGKATLSYVATNKGRTRLVFSLNDATGPVKTLEPYLESGGHLVIFSADNQRYWHSHPGGTSFLPPLEFLVDDLADGRYVAFLQYQVEGVLYTRRFLLEIVDGK